MNQSTPYKYGKGNREQPAGLVESALDDCLEQVLRHDANPEACLCDYPDLAAELYPLVELAAALAALSDVSPSPSFKQKTRRLLTSLREPPVRHRSFDRRDVGHNWFKRAAIGLLAALVLLSLGSGGITASRAALPGTPLYSVKRQVESLQLALTQDAASQATVQLMVAERRLDEAEQLASTGSEALAEQTVGEYDRHMSSALDNLELVPESTKSPAVATFDEHLSKRHQELSEREARAEETAKKPLQHALTITERANERVTKIRSMTHKDSD
jgi:hypothetical protein